MKKSSFTACRCRNILLDESLKNYVEEEFAAGNREKADQQDRTSEVHNQG